MKRFRVFFAAAAICLAPLTTLGSGRYKLADDTERIPALLALLNDGQLLSIDVTTGAIVRTTRVAQSPIGNVGYFMSAIDGRHVAVLAGPCVMSVDVSSLETTWSSCEMSEIPWPRALTTTNDGTIYVAGGDTGELRITSIDAASGRIKRSATVALPASQTWFVHSIASADAGRLLFVSYHGPNTTGADRFDLATGSIVRCTGQVAVSSGCISGHGRVTVSGESLFITTGGRREIWEYSLDGKQKGQYDTGFRNNHLMEVLVDDRAEHLYAVGPCDQEGGVAEIPLGLAGPTRGMPTVWSAFDKAFNMRPCGNRLAEAAGYLVVAQSPGAVPQVGRSGSLLVMDRLTGKGSKHVVLSSEAVDILGLRSN